MINTHTIEARSFLKEQTSTISLKFRDEGVLLNRYIFWTFYILSFSVKKYNVSKAG
jgi:hypothetical protein